jgi:geranylgeranyl diphosphate synthase type II
LACALKIGAILADAPMEQADLLYRFGENLGLAFQLQDDYLDVYGDPAVFGKKIGGDILCNKKTYMFINAFRLASPEDRAVLDMWVAKAPGSYVPDEKIVAVTALYDKMAIGKLCQEKILYYFKEAQQVLAQLPLTDERKKPLWDLAEYLLGRKS